VSVVVAEKVCRRCGETKPLSDYYHNKATSDGFTIYCKPCCRWYTETAKAKRRAEMGEEAWLEQQRQVVRQSRQRRNYDRERLQSRAQTAAVRRLVEAHRAEYEQYLREEKHGRGLL
jgi:hypothetical protein